jgi:hypothetical protein
METNTVNLKTEALKNGVIWGIISIVIFLVVWYVAPSLMGGYIYTGITFLIGLALAIFFCLDMRKKAGAYWSFGDALWNIFVMFLMSVLIIYVFTIIFGKFIDTSYPVKMKELTMEKTESMLQSLGLGEQEIAETMEKTSESMEKQFNPSFMQAVVGFGIASIFYFIGALIFAAIFKRSNPNPYHLHPDNNPPTVIN